MAIAGFRVRRADRQRPFRFLTAYSRLEPAEAKREELALYDCGVRAVDGHESQRNGVAEVVSASANNADFFSACTSIIRRLADDASKDVRLEVLQVFRLDDLLEYEDAAALLRDVVKSKGFRDNPSPLLWALKEKRTGLTRYAEAVLAVCDVFAGDLAEDSRDLRTGIAADTGTVSELLLRLYGEASDILAADLRSACLDRWDRLLQARVGHARETLRQIDSG
jgi:hypothetical protein